jgi:antitoxin component YwqK of YwqJK toxin-antitoxin module
MLEGNYEAGLLNGKRIMYYPDGSIWIEDNFIESTRFGVKAIYDKAGKPMLKETYFAGLLHGECNYYDAAGNLISSYFYYDGDAEKKLK